MLSVKYFYVKYYTLTHIADSTIGFMASRAVYGFEFAQGGLQIFSG